MKHIKTFEEHEDKSLITKLDLSDGGLGNYIKSLKDIEEVDNNIEDVLETIHDAVIKQINSEITNDELDQVLNNYGSLIHYNLYNISMLTNYMSDYGYKIDNAYQTIMYIYEKLNYVTLTSYIKE